MLSLRGLMVLWLACVMARPDDEACALQKAPGKTKIRDNYVYFHTGPFTPAQWVQFDETSHSITQGQPYDGVSSVDGYKLDVRAGRHGSKEVADDFNAGITGDNALGLLNYGDPLPSELNFAVFGTMSVTIDDATRVCQDMRIAQGHWSTRNNWWIAGTKCYYHDNLELTCPCDVATVTFSGMALSSHDFYVQFD